MAGTGAGLAWGWGQMHYGCNAIEEGGGANPGWAGALLEANRTKPLSRLVSMHGACSGFMWLAVDNFRRTSQFVAQPTVELHGGWCGGRELGILRLSDYIFNF